DASGLARLDEVADGGVYPGVLVDAEDDRRVLANFQLVDGRLREEFAVDAYALHHRLADFRFGHLAHALRHQLEVAVACDAERSPKLTAAVYQLAKRTESAMKRTATTVRSRSIRLRL